MISIIITTKNEEKNIKRILNSISKFFDKNKIEVIIIDNYSDDNTENIVKEFQVKFIQLGPERSAQRNHGIKISNFNYLLILDADMEVTSGVQNELFSLINSNYDYAYLNEKIIHQGILGKIRNFERSLYHNTDINCPRFFKKKIFVNEGFFNEKLTGLEDTEFNFRLKNKNYKNKIMKSTINHYEIELSFLDTVAKKVHYILNSKEFFKYNIKTQQFNIIFRLIGIYFYKDNLSKTLKNPLIFFATFTYKLLQTFCIIALLIRKKYL
jgi:glycosyltransferase involved in cell wall biosynthesis